MIMQSQKMMMLRASAACLPCRVLRACEERSMSHLCRTHREHARIIPMRDSATQNQIYFLVKLSFSLISICQIEATLSRPKTMRGQFSVTSRMKRRSSRNGNLFFLLLLVVQVGHGFGFIASQKVISSDRALLIQKSKAISKDNDESDRSHLVFPGGGIFFNWQGGVITYLREQGYDLTSCDFVGSSAGSLTATFAATGVDFYEATDLALKMASKYDVWDRKDGLKGVLRPMIEEWLQTLVPSSLDIDEIDGRLSLLVTPVPLLWEKQKISSFTDRNDLIECNLASIYLVS